MKNILIFLIILTAIPLFSQNKIQIFEQEKNQKGLVKRTVAILPVHNASLNPEFDYLSGNLSAGLRAALNDSNSFVLIDQGAITKKMQELNISVNKFIWEEEAINLSLALGCDVVVFGFYQIDTVKEEITMNFNALDARLRKSAVRQTSKGPLGIEIFKTIKNGSKEMSDKMVLALKPFKELVRLSPQTNAAISLTASGTFLLLASIPLLTVSELYVAPLVKEFEPNTTSFTYEGYQKYSDYYNARIALLYSGFSCIGVGALMIGGSIPLFYFGLKKDVKKVTYFRFEPDHFEAGISLRF
jgi:hypothetical protein